MTVDDAGADRPRAPSSPEQLRKITDARTMRALAHPVRIALLEELALGGALTATQLGERIGETPTTCSFHLRQLARYGFVEEAGGGKGRARPWRLTSIGISFGKTHDDPAAEVAAGALSRMVHERQIARLQNWLDARASYPREWRDAAGDTEWLLYVTPAELKALNEELFAMFLPRFHERLTDPSKRPAGSLPVELLMYSFPVEPPAAPGDEPGGEPGSGGAE